MRLGSTQSVRVDVRLISASNANIREMIEKGTFRQDLLYRMNTVEIHIPPLRERGEDIILLAEHFLKKYNHKYKKEIKGLNREARQKLLKYSWPGNVRELQHAIERSVILSEDKWLAPSHFPLDAGNKAPVDNFEALNLETVERQVIEKAMKRAAGNISQAASLLGITRYALYRKLEKFGL